MRLKLLAGLAALLPLTACFGGGNVPDALLNLTPVERPATATPRAATDGRVFVVNEPITPQALSVRRVPVYVDPITIQYLQGATWVEEPSALLRRVLSDTIAARTGLVALDPALTTQVSGQVLSGQLSAFGLDPGRSEVVAIYEAALTRPGAGVTANRFEVRVPVTEPTAAAVGPALNQAANQLAVQVADWIGG